MSGDTRLPADHVLSIARHWFSDPANHERDNSEARWLPETCDENAAVYLAMFGMELLKDFAPAAPAQTEERP